MTDDDREWPDPPITDDRDTQRSAASSSRLRVRLACATVVFGVVVLWSAGYLVQTVGMVWPPRDSIARWSTLVLLSLLGYVVLPLLVGGWVGDQVYDRWLVDDDEPE